MHLPTLGRLVLGPEETAQAATVDVAGGLVSSGSATAAGRWPAPACSAAWRSRGHADGGRAASWQPVRRLCAPGIRVALEDTDPYRDCHQWQPAPRLTDAEFDQWQRQFREAWQEIECGHRATPRRLPRACRR